MIPAREENSNADHQMPSWREVFLYFLFLGFVNIGGPSAAQTAVVDIKASILMLLANGLKDDVIAKRIGLSVRACRGHIADLMEVFGARSRFQAGVIAARSGMLEPESPSS